MSALAYALSDDDRIAMIRAGHERYLRRTAGAVARFESGSVSRAGFDVTTVTELLSPGEWPRDLDPNHLELDEEGCE